MNIVSVFTEEETAKYEPVKDDCGRVVENLDDYVKRIRSTRLPNFPTDVLSEWLYRHAGCVYIYAHLFKHLRFEKQTWRVSDIPGRAAFNDEIFCDNFSVTFDDRAASLNPSDWLANFMNVHGTWNTPIILLDNSNGTAPSTCYAELKQPYHLLEGHRRLSFLVALRRKRKALAEHQIWLATYSPE